MKKPTKKKSSSNEVHQEVPVVAVVAPTKSKPFSGKIIAVSLGTAVLIVALCGVAFWQYQSNFNQQQLSGAEIKTLVTAVEKIIALPAGETPDVATVVDVKLLAGQPFFSNARNGDKVLIYANAKKAYLYRPGQNKIIEVGPISPQVPQVAGAQSVASIPAELTPSPSAKTVTVAIYNATAVPRLAAKIKERLTGSDRDLTVVSTENAAQYYPETMVVDLQHNPEDAAAIAETLHGVVTDLPETETVPQADILVIAGENYTE